MITIILDTETTGVDIKTAMPVEIAALALDNGFEMIGSFQTLCNPGIPIPAGASEIHGITDASIANSPTVHSVLTNLLPEWLERLNIDPKSDVGIVCHNADYDMGIINRLYIEWIGEALTSDYLCTMKDKDRNPIIKCVKDAWGRWKWPKLTECCEHIGYQFVGAHGALNDCLATLAVLKYELKHGLITLE